MKKLLILIVAFVFLLQAARTQNLSYLSLNVGPKFDHYRLTDQGDGIFYKPDNGKKFGFTIGHEFMKNVFAEVGFSYNQVWDATHYKVFPQSYGSCCMSFLLGSFTDTRSIKTKYPCRGLLVSPVHSMHTTEMGAFPMEEP